MDININATVNTYNNPRLIVADFDDVCNMCFEKIASGEKIAWYGKGYGVRHYSCYMKRSTLLTNEEFDKLSNW